MCPINDLYVLRQEATKSGDGRLDEEEFLRACGNVFGDENMVEYKPNPCPMRNKIILIVTV